jgi:hypothetical protein
MSRIKNVSGEDLVVPWLGDRLVQAGQIVEVPDADVYSYTQTASWEPTDKAARDAHKDGSEAYEKRLAEADSEVESAPEDVIEPPADDTTTEEN